MLFVDKNGLVDAERIIKRFSTIERGKLDKVNGIVVHQTGDSTAEISFNSYKHTGANGAHFLIDKDGNIYQTASVFKVTNHVGNIRSRCYMLRWLVAELTYTLKVPMTEIFRHPEVSYKVKTEAGTARW
ncbi:hypothetical protein HA49_20910 [Tatumella morbirosei]|uniref:N-acetylmuramoyl-L-alanine amidase domain-containing protein n=1 Tax=Tatumella morbirosei TaxID=642227 RepID=A0A095T0B7_9GAMM|nr:N-acetylmuramoyl-L-alanine amidase [Tatumella morbirosei]KGD70386.1 hypothetical protein HA49_20910 [Tatumella morbirosei]